MYASTRNKGVFVFLFFPALLFAEPPLGMWAWKQAHFQTLEARAEMLAFCEREGISHIDQHLSIKDGFIRNFQSLEKLVAEAAGRGITVNALRGDKQMFYEANHARTREDLQTIIDFNRQLPEAARLAGVKFDVEPYLTPEWKAGGEQREKVIRAYLVFLQTAKQQLEGTGLELSVDVPFWWDKPVYEIEFAGETKRFAHHIQDIVDWMGIMSYRRESRLVLKFVKDELAYAKQIDKDHSVAPGLETSKIQGKEAFISFGGVPPEQFRTTLAEVREQLAENPNVRCIMLHHYGSLIEYLQQPNEDPRP